MPTARLAASVVLVVALSAMTPMPTPTQLAAVPPAVVLPVAVPPAAAQPVAVPSAEPVLIDVNPVLTALDRMASPTPDPAAAPPGSGTATAAAADAKTPVSAASPWRVAGAVGAAVAEADDAGITQGVVVIDRQSGAVLASANAREEFAAMSVMKLFIAADMITAAGASGPTAQDSTALHQMIAASDDDIASLYYDKLGGSSMITRVADRYSLTGTTPADQEQWWGDVQTTPADLASFLDTALTDRATGSLLGSAMRDSTDIAADGQSQDFGVHAIAGAGSKQGWGCCLSGVLSIHSVGFTSSTIVVVLSKTQPGVADQEALMTAATATAAAALTTDARSG